MLHNFDTEEPLGASIPNQDADLSHLLARASRVASFSGKKMMESAGMSWQSLAAWKAGTRRPRPDSIRAVGHALLVQANRIRQIGLELIQAADQMPGAAEVDNGDR